MDRPAVHHIQACTFIRIPEGVVFVEGLGFGGVWCGGVDSR